MNCTNCCRLFPNFGCIHLAWSLAVPIPSVTHFTCAQGASIKYVRTKGEGGGPNIVQFSGQTVLEMWMMGEGVKKSADLADK